MQGAEAEVQHDLPPPPVFLDEPGEKLFHNGVHGVRGHTTDLGEGRIGHLHSRREALQYR